MKNIVWKVALGLVLVISVSQTGLACGCWPRKKPVVPAATSVGAGAALVPKLQRTHAVVGGVLSSSDVSRSGDASYESLRLFMMKASASAVESEGRDTPVATRSSGGAHGPTVIPVETIIKVPHRYKLYVYNHTFELRPGEWSIGIFPCCEPVARARMHEISPGELVARAYVLYRLLLEGNTEKIAAFFKNDLYTTLDPVRQQKLFDMRVKNNRHERAQAVMSMAYRPAIHDILQHYKNLTEVQIQEMLKNLDERGALTGLLST